MPGSTARPRRRPPAASRPAAPSSCGSPPRPPNTEVTDSGEIVEIGKSKQRQQVAFPAMRRRLRAGIVLLFLASGRALGLRRLGGADRSAADRHRGPDTAASRPAGVGLKRIGDFDNPVYVDRGAGLPASCCSSSSSAARSSSCAAGTGSPHPFLDISGLVAFEGERGLLSIAFPPDYKQQWALLRLLHRQARQHPHRRIPAPHPDPGRVAARGAR